MKMYKCTECGHIFEEGEQATFEESRGEHFGCPAYEQMSGCPICKEPYEEIEPCKICGSYEHDADEEYCDQCKIDVRKRFETFVLNAFTVEERELLNELYDGERI
jgi:hypothetical protein